MEEDEDLRLARLLQQEEEQQHQERLREQERRDDAALAQLLQQEFNQQDARSSARYVNYPSTRVSSSSHFTHMRAGQTVDVRLKHPKTSSFIGETLRAHYLDTSEIRFEVIKAPGKVMRVNDIGKVEFSDCAPDDPTSRFRFELTLQGNVYLKCAAHLHKMNIAGEIGWFLAISHDGSLLGNSNRGVQAQWSLVAEQTPYTLHPNVPSYAPAPIAPGYAYAAPVRSPAYASAGAAPVPASASWPAPPAPAQASAAAPASPAPAPAPAQKSFLSGALSALTGGGGRRGSGSEHQPLAQDETDYEMQELNPLLFTQASAAEAPRSTAGAAEKDAPTQNSGLDLQKLYASPQFAAFSRTLQPGLRAAVEADALAFLRAVQSPELWALLEAVPPSLLSNTGTSTLASAAPTSGHGQFGGDSPAGAPSASSDNRADTGKVSSVADGESALARPAGDQADIGEWEDVAHADGNVNIRAVSKRNSPTRGPVFGGPGLAQPGHIVGSANSNENNKIDL